PVGLGAKRTLTFLSAMSYFIAIFKIFCKFTSFFAIIIVFFRIFAHEKGNMGQIGIFIQRNAPFYP
uniref:hypothetical protein n=1 Tax=Segatella hominis TaxID=2518605 RepID=UPI004038A21E